MKSWNWMIFGCAGALALANGAYDAWRSPEEKLKAVGEECRSRIVEAGRTPAFAQRVCDCMVTKAKNWHDRNPDGDYTREIHQNLAKQCIAGWG